MTAIDYSDARYTGTQLNTAGVTAVGRYLTGAGKAISASELADLTSRGINVWFVFEDVATDTSSGYSGGASHAQQANAALTALSLPISQPVYFAADEDLPTPSTAVPYFQGIASVRPAATNGDYGEGALSELLASEGLTAFHWQSESTSFPGNATTWSGSHIQQSTHTPPLPDTDLDLLLKSDFGQYPRPCSQEDTMITELVSFNATNHQIQRNASGLIWHFYQAQTPGAPWGSEGLPLAGGFVGNPILYVNEASELVVECEQGASNESLMVNTQPANGAWSGWVAKA